MKHITKRQITLFSILVAIIFIGTIFLANTELFSQPKVYEPQDFVVYSNRGVDIREMSGNLQTCVDACNANNACVGFSRSKNAADNSVSQCWLKRDLSPRLRSVGPFRTFVKPQPQPNRGVQPPTNQLGQPKVYEAQDFVVYSNRGVDVGETSGNLQTCKDACNANNSCLGFSRAKNVPDNSISQCWFKRDLSPNLRNVGPYQTFVKKDGGPQPSKSSQPPNQIQHNQKQYILSTLEDAAKKAIDTELQLQKIIDQHETDVNTLLKDKSTIDGKIQSTRERQTYYINQLSQAKEISKKTDAELSQFRKTL